MSQRGRELLTQALSLPDAERAELAAGLLESLDPSTDSDAAAEWDKELERRVAELDHGAVAPIPWSEARSMIVGDANESA